jgi:hypothetical protein
MFGVSGSLQPGELLVEHVSPRGPVATAVRGTLVVSAIEGLRAQGALESLIAELPPTLRDELLATSALRWVPMQQLVELCLAVDRLRLTDRQLADIGGAAASSIAATVLSTILRTAGASPWTIVGNLDRLWDRFYEGGGITVMRMGPKDVFIELTGMPHGVTRYCRATTQAFFQALTGKLARGVQATATRPRTPAPMNFAFVLSWT